MYSTTRLEVAVMNATDEMAGKKDRQKEAGVEVLEDIADAISNEVAQMKDVRADIKPYIAVKTDTQCGGFISLYICLAYLTV